MPALHKSSFLFKLDSWIYNGSMPTQATDLWHTNVACTVADAPHKKLTQLIWFLLHLQCLYIGPHFHVNTHRLKLLHRHTFFIVLFHLWCHSKYQWNNTLELQPWYYLFTYVPSQSFSDSKQITQCKLIQYEEASNKQRFRVTEFCKRCDPPPRSLVQKIPKPVI